VVDAGRADDDARLARGVDVAVDIGTVDDGEAAGGRWGTGLGGGVAKGLGLAAVVRWSSESQ